MKRGGTVVIFGVSGLSVDYVAHMAESYIHAKFDDREHRVIAMLEHSGFACENPTSPPKWGFG
eukprot:4770079-Amphidinium_carterae.1